MSEPTADVSLVPAHDIGAIQSLVLDSVRSEHSKRAYAKSLEDFLDWIRRTGVPAFTKAALQRYRSELEARRLAPSTVNVRLSAIRKLALEAADNGLLSPEIADGIARVRGVRRSGVRLGQWLTREQAELLLSAPDTSTLQGKRDRAILAMLVGAGLRRTEASLLTFEHLQQRDGRWVLVDLIGKADRIRTVPIPSWAKTAADEWIHAAGLDHGRLFRPINKSGRLAGQWMTPQSIFLVVRRHAEASGIPVSPHDLRRTFARLAYQGASPLEQIQLSLGHASVATTERYLGTRQNLQDAPCDRLGLTLSRVGV